MKLALFLGPLAVMGLVGPSAAQDGGSFRIESGLSTLGVHLAPTFELSDRFSLRAPLHFGAYSDTFDVEGNTVDATIDATNTTLMVDFSPWANALRVSGGVGMGGYVATAEMTDLTLDGNTFTGTSTLRVAQKSSVAPVLSLGFAHQFDNGFALFGDIGGRFATYEASIDTTIALGPSEQADLDASVADINDDLANFWVTPFVTIGFGFEF